MAPSAGSGMELKVHVGTSDERLVGGQAQFIFFPPKSVHAIMIIVVCMYWGADFWGFLADADCISGWAHSRAPGYINFIIII
jgi:hypothetical protein